MNSATFLLAFNFAIGLSFAAAFLAVSRRSSLALGRYCAAGFVAAASTVAIEGMVAAIPSVRLASTLSFGSLMTALTAITAGLVRHYRPQARTGALWTVLVVAVIANAFVVFDFPRGTWEQAFGYQGPFAAMLAIAATIVARHSPRRPVDLALAAVLGLSALQFAAKLVMLGLAGAGPGVRAYLSSPYAFYSQTAGGILSLLLGLSLLGLLMAETMAEARDRLQTDALSGLPNRAAFLERAARTLRALPPGESAALIMADLDRFKAINDTYGHSAGDAVIRAFGANLRAHCGEGALCGRLGGEEFALLIPACTPQTARAHVEAVRALGRRTRYPELPEGHAVTASFGVTLMARDEPLETALHRADMALYAVKKAGRDGLRFAPDPRTAQPAPAQLLSNGFCEVRRLRRIGVPGRSKASRRALTR
ncbi:sensor domain-containing diguanylate cyclase [Methylobacterium sp. J-067]|uniref:GGDEF domain-containing protein n=1 Tax=Methylobacterium sp. J-067 TaxID=2836648 RepID=UPI001FBAE83B|nr:GGDEF domain-containing protein [Methylobacterium sp. J-067]MCJ2026099.1 GGDEF domain-containing protein [Methylobacterium sp. J-067]